MADYTNSEETSDGLKRRAYSTALKLRKEGLDREAVFARLEKQGIPEPIIEDVLGNLTKKIAKDRVTASAPNRQIAWFKIAVAIASVLISYLTFPDQVVIPIGIALSGTIYLLATRKRS